MTKDWQPADLEEVVTRVTGEKRGFEPVDLAQWAQVAVAPFQARITRSGDFGEERVFVVARDGASVIFFDDAEDEFGGAVLDASGKLKACTSFGELKHALRRFRRAST